MSFKSIYLARRNPAVSRENWPRTWRSHAIFASKNTTVGSHIDFLRYCNRVDQPMIGGEPVDIPRLSSAHDGVAVVAGGELTGINTPGANPVIDEDERRVFDMLVPNFAYFCKETLLCEGKPTDVALITFLAKKPGISRDEFNDRWTEDHAAIAEQAIGEIESISRYAHNLPLHDPLPLFPFEGIVEAWFTVSDAAVRALTNGSLDPIDRDLAEFCDMDASVIMLTGVFHRYPKD